MKIGNVPIDNESCRISATAGARNSEKAAQNKGSIRRDTFDMSSISKLMSKAASELKKIETTVRHDKIEQFRSFIAEKDIFQDRIIDKVLTKMSE